MIPTISEDRNWKWWKLYYLAGRDAFANHEFCSVYVAVKEGKWYLIFHKTLHYRRHNRKDTGRYTRRLQQRAEYSGVQQRQRILTGIKVAISLCKARYLFAEVDKITK